jgi:hypothetical protein
LNLRFIKEERRKEGMELEITFFGEAGIQFGSVRTDTTLLVLPCQMNGWNKDIRTWRIKLQGKEAYGATLNVMVKLGARR